MELLHYYYKLAPYEKFTTTNENYSSDLSVFEKIVYLLVPSIRMQCSLCNVAFVWVYDFVGPKRRYSNLFRARAAEQAIV